MHSISLLETLSSFESHTFTHYSTTAAISVSGEGSAAASLGSTCTTQVREIKHLGISTTHILFLAAFKSVNPVSKQALATSGTKTTVTKVAFHPVPVNIVHEDTGTTHTIAMAFIVSPNL